MKIVVRAGGAGTRLWPFSRRRRPKQFHAMTGPQSMIQEAVARVRPLASAEDLFVSTGEATAGLVREHLPDLGPRQLIVEPALRNTGPAVGLECALLEGRYPGCVVASLGSDHYIGDAAEFRRLLAAAEAAVAEHPDFLLTIGVLPTRPETGYGYIRKGEVLCEVSGRAVYRVPEFREKPDAKMAAQYVRSGDYLWNSNMFVWKAAAVLELFERFEPEIFPALAEDSRGGPRPDLPRRRNRRSLPRTAVDLHRPRRPRARPPGGDPRRGVRLGRRRQLGGPDRRAARGRRRQPVLRGPFSPSTPAASPRTAAGRS